MQLDVHSSLLFTILLILSFHSDRTNSQRGPGKTSSSRGSGATGARTSYGGGGRSGSVLNPDSGFSSAQHFSSGGNANVRKTVMGFSNNIVRARDKISHSMKNIFRPKVKVPRPLVNRPMSPVYKTSYAGSYLGRNRGSSTGRTLMAGVGGYLLGRILSKAATSSHEGKGFYSYYQPFRSRYGVTRLSITTGKAAELDSSAEASMVKNKNVDLCMLQRWNQELPFSEIPNMAMDSLANDSISGEDVASKSTFMFEFLSKTRSAYGNVSPHAEIFLIPEAYDMETCNFKVAEEPIDVAINHVARLYTNASKTTEMLQDLTEAVQACLPRESGNMTAKLYTCLDYSIEPEQILRLRHADSIFNNDEICRKYLSPRLLACETKSGKGCSVHHLVSINMFARNYYLCSESIHGDTVHILQDDAYLREYDASAGPSIYTQSKHLFYICSIIVVWTNLLTQNTD